MDQLTPIQLNLHPIHSAEIISAVSEIAPIEACGIIGGDALSSRKIYPIRNILQSPNVYLMDAAEMLQAFMDIEDQGWDIVAFYHSHPHSFPSPSQTDLDQNYYPDTPYVIAGKIDGKWELRAYILNDDQSREIPIVTPQIHL